MQEKEKNKNKVVQLMVESKLVYLDSEVTDELVDSSRYAASNYFQTQGLHGFHQQAVEVWNLMTDHLNDDISQG